MMNSDERRRQRANRARMTAISLAGLGIAANLLLSAEDGSSTLKIISSRKLALSDSISDDFLEDLETSMNAAVDGEDDEALMTSKFHKDITRRLEENMMNQQTLFRPPTEEEHRVLYGDDESTAPASKEGGTSSTKMNEMIDGIVKTLRGGNNHDQRDGKHTHRTLGTSELESLHRARELRELSIDLGGGECQWTQPTLITETDANDVEATWLAAYPGSGKRLTVKLVEALSGNQVSFGRMYETWPCIWSAVMDDHPNAKRNGKGPNNGAYAMNSTHLQIIMNETEYIIDKYSGAEWADDAIATELVSVVTEYHTTNAAELATVMAQEQNCAPNPCLNGGTCEEGQSVYFPYYSQKCSCPEGEEWNMH